MKVLIISHNPITTYNNMGKTMMSLFSSFKKDELCQLYIYPTLPDIDFCSSYYRITDKDILKSYLSFFRVNGHKIDKSQIKKDNTMFDRAEDIALYRNRKNKAPMRSLARDLMWKFSCWYNKDLKYWLSEEKPDYIFVAPGSAKFLYDIALKISQKNHIPIICYICDDYYFMKTPTGVLKKLRFSLLKRKIERLMVKSSLLITICDEIKDLYHAHFNIPAITIMTGTNYDIAQEYNEKTAPSVITYMGNIRCNRYLSLADIGQALDSINKTNGTNYELHIYSGEKDKVILSHFDNIDSLKFCGYVQGEEFDAVFRSSQILLHVESFDENSIDAVKHSVSTKIADSLASGIPLFAYGPDSVSSMKHLINNCCAITSTSKNDLTKALIDVFENYDLRKASVQKAIETTKKYHDSSANSAHLYSIFDDFQP